MLQCYLQGSDIAGRVNGGDFKWTFTKADDESSLTEYLKIETSTSISFTTDSTSTLTLVLNSDFSKYIIVDGVKYKANKGLVTVELEAGEHTIKKGDAAKLYYMSVK